MYIKLDKMLRQLTHHFLLVSS